VDINEIMNKTPEIEKLFGGVWMVTWFLAIWIYHIQFFLTGLFCLFLAILLLGYFNEKKQKFQFFSRCIKILKS
jgi:hypothetical protein